MKIIAIRKVDKSGRIVLPMDLRKKHELNQNVLVGLFEYDNYIAIRKITNHCIMCSSENNLFSFKEVFICSSCIEKIKKYKY